MGGSRYSRGGSLLGSPLQKRSGKIWYQIASEAQAGRAGSMEVEAPAVRCCAPAFPDVRPHSTPKPAATMARDIESRDIKSDESLSRARQRKILPSPREQYARDRRRTMSRQSFATMSLSSLLPNYRCQRTVRRGRLRSAGDTSSPLLTPR